MEKIMIVNGERYDREKACIAHVVIRCDDTQARVVKDRQGIAFNASIAVDRIPLFIEATYPGFEVQDCR